MSPMARTRRMLESEGYLVDTVERWIPGANVRRDLFGFLDLVAIREGETLGVQVTTADHVAHRRVKMLGLPSLPHVLRAGWRVEIHGWRKVKGRWTPRRERVGEETSCSKSPVFQARCDQQGS